MAMFVFDEFVWAIINFLIFFAIMRIVFFKPIMNLLDSRRAEVAENLQKSEEARKEAEQLRREYEEKLNQAASEARDLIERARREGEQRREELVAAAQEEAERILDRARTAIREERDRAIAALREEVADLALLAASKVVDKDLTGEDNERLVREFIRQVEGH